MEIIELFSAYVNPVITIFCLLVGFLLNKWLKDENNRVIPTAVAAVGLVAAVATNIDSVTIEVIVGGLLSGLASTGLHQAFKQWLDKGQ